MKKTLRRTISLYIVLFRVLTWGAEPSMPTPFDGLRFSPEEIADLWRPFLASNHCTYTLLESNEQRWFEGAEWHCHRVRIGRENGDSMLANLVYFLEDPAPGGGWSRIRLFTLKRYFVWDPETGWCSDQWHVGPQMTLREWLMIPTLDIRLSWPEQPIREGFLKPVGEVSSMSWDELSDRLHGMPDSIPTIPSEEEAGVSDEDPEPLERLKRRVSEAGADAVAAVEAKMLAIDRKCSWSDRGERCHTRTIGDFYVLPLSDQDAKPFLDLFGPEPDFCSLCIVRPRPGQDSDVHVQAYLRYGCRRIGVSFISPQCSPFVQHVSAERLEDGSFKVVYYDDGFEVVDDDGVLPREWISRCARVFDLAADARPFGVFY